MHAGYHEMLFVRYQRQLRLGVGPPENKDQRRLALVELLYHRICQLLPASAAVRIRLMLPDGQRCIEQQHARLAQGIRQPLSYGGGSMPRSDRISLKIFTSEGGCLIPF